MIGAWLNVSSSPCFAWSSMISYAIVTPIYLHANPFCEYRQVADEQGWTTIELFSFVLVSCFWHALDVCAMQRVVLEVDPAEQPHTYLHPPYVCPWAPQF